MARAPRRVRKSRQAPVLHLARQRQLPQEVPQVVGQGEQLEPHLVVLSNAKGTLLIALATQRGRC